MDVNVDDDDDDDRDLDRTIAEAGTHALDGAAHADVLDLLAAHRDEPERAVLGRVTRSVEPTADAERRCLREVASLAAQVTYDSDRTWKPTTVHTTANSTRRLTHHARPARHLRHATY